MEDAPKLLKSPKSECPDIWIRLPRHKWCKSWSSMEDPRQFQKIQLKYGCRENKGTPTSSERVLNLFGSRRTLANLDERGRSEASFGSPYRTCMNVRELERPSWELRRTLKNEPWKHLNSFIATYRTQANFCLSEPFCT